MFRQVYFSEKPDEAVAELNQDIRRSLRAIIRSRHNPPPDSFLTSAESMLGAFKGLEVLHEYADAVDLSLMVIRLNLSYTLVRPRKITL